MEMVFLECNLETLEYGDTFCAPFGRPNPEWLRKRDLESHTPETKETHMAWLAQFEDDADDARSAPPSEG
jgi:hypothetical protein